MNDPPCNVKFYFLALVLMFCNKINAYPVSQPAYEQPQYITAQALPSTGAYKSPTEYVQVHHPQYAHPSQQQRTVRPVYEGKAEGLGQYYTSPQQQQPQHIQTVLLTSNADRQIQKTAQQSNPAYYQQVLSAQQQGLGQEAIAAAQRKATSSSLRRLQPIPVPVHQPEHREQTQLYQPQVRYVPRPTAAESQQYSGSVQQQRDESEAARKVPEDDFDHNPSYQFGFDVKDDQYTNYQNRKEQREGNKITGSYSVVDADGFIRTVHYTADPKEGFKAEVTREPTDIKVKVPKPQPKYQHVAKHQQSQPQYILQEVSPQPREQQYQTEQQQYAREPQQYSREQYQQARPTNLVYRYE